MDVGGLRIGRVGRVALVVTLVVVGVVVVGVVAGCWSNYIEVGGEGR